MSKRPLPQPNQTTQPFWDGARKRKLMLQYDPATRRYQFWPRPGSIWTGKRNLQWRETSGRGEIYAFTVTHLPPPGFEGQAPYLLGLVELDEGVRVIANLTGIAPEDAAIGMRVQVAWEKLSDDITWFVFEPEKRRRKPGARRAKT